MTTRSVPTPRLGRSLLFASAVFLTACGVASISPIVPEDVLEFDPALLGRWQSTESTEFALITGDSSRGYEIAYVDEDGARGRFDARLGQLGQERVFDVRPTGLDLSREGPLYESLILPLHSLVVIDSVSPTDLYFRLVNADSLKALLLREPTALAHTEPHGEVAPIITAPTVEVRRFFERLLGMPGMLVDSAHFVRVLHR